MHHHLSANKSRFFAASLVLVFATLACTALGGSLPTATPATIPTRIAATPTESRPPTSTTVPTRAPTANSARADAFAHADGNSDSCHLDVSGHAACTPISD